jgi:hypothetical protein
MRLTSMRAPRVGCNATGRFHERDWIHRSTDGGQTWGPVMSPAPGGVLPNSTQDKEFLAVDNSGGPFDGRVYVTWTSFPPTPLPAGAVAQTPIFFSRSSGADFSAPSELMMIPAPTTSCFQTSQSTPEASSRLHGTIGASTRESPH